MFILCHHYSKHFTYIFTPFILTTMLWDLDAIFIIILTLQLKKMNTYNEWQSQDLKPDSLNNAPK